MEPKVFKVKDYIAILEHEADGIGDEFLKSPIHAQAIATISAVMPDLDPGKIKRLPNAVAWSLFQKCVDDDLYKEDVIKKAESVTEGFTTEALKEGVEDMLAGRDFLIYIETGGHKFGLKQTSGRPALRTLLKDINDKEFSSMVKSRTLTDLLICVSKVDGELLPVAGVYDKLKELPFLEYMLLAEVQVRLQGKLYSMDWKALLKN